MLNAYIYYFSSKFGQKWMPQIFLLTWMFAKSRCSLLDIIHPTQTHEFWPVPMVIYVVNVHKKRWNTSTMMWEVQCVRIVIGPGRTHTDCQNHIDSDMQHEIPMSLDSKWAHLRNYQWCSCGSLRRNRVWYRVIPAASLDPVPTTCIVSQSTYFIKLSATFCYFIAQYPLIYHRNDYPFNSSENAISEIFYNCLYDIERNDL